MSSVRIYLILTFVVIVSIGLTLTLVSRSKSEYMHITPRLAASTITPLADALNMLGYNNPCIIRNPRRDKVITWAWHKTGFNNIRMATEILFGLSVIYNRTLVLPPRSPWDHIESKDECCYLEDFYNIASIKATFNVLQAKEWFGRDVTYSEYIHYFKARNGLEPKKLLACNDLWRVFDKKLGKNKSRIWFFDIFMFGNLDDYFRDSKKLPIIRKKLFDGFKFKSAFINKTISCLTKRDINTVGSYNALHIRRGDFKQFRPGHFRTDIKYYINKLHSYFDTKVPLLLITDEKDMSKLHWVKENFPHTFTLRECDDVKKETSRLITDIIACTMAARFVGTAESTFSYYIQILRGYLSKYYPEIDNVPVFLQENSEKFVKDQDNWSCKKGCWNIIDTDRWEKLE